MIIIYFVYFYNTIVNELLGSTETTNNIQITNVVNITNGVCSLKKFAMNKGTVVCLHVLHNFALQYFTTHCTALPETS